MIIESVKEYMKSCPCLAGKKINVNCLGVKPRSFSIDNVEAESVIKKYCDGGEVKQAVFTLSVRDKYDELPDENIYVINLLEEVEKWIFRQNSIKNLPCFDSDEAVPTGVEVTKSGHLHDTSMGSGRWQMEFRVVYKMNTIIRGF